MHDVGVALSGTFLLRDSAGSPITGAIAGDFAVAPIAALGPSGATTGSVTITERANGQYGYTFTPSVAGDWDYYHKYDDDNEWLDTYDVTDPVADAQTFASAVLAGIVQPIGR